MDLFKPVQYCVIMLQFNIASHIFQGITLQFPGFTAVLLKKMLRCVIL